MKLILLLPVLLIAAMINPPTNWYHFDKDGTAMFFSEARWQIIDANNYTYDCKVVKLDHEGAFRWMLKGWPNVYDMKAFGKLSQNWKPRQVVPPSDPNTLPKLVVVPEPNEPVLSYIPGICYTVGGKHHLFYDCQYLKNKDWKPCICSTDPNDICLICIARKANND